MTTSVIPMLSHYCERPVPSVHSVPQPRFATDKPRGLWVSVDDGGDGWAEWCRHEGFRLDSLAVEHSVVLKPEARILLLSTAEAVDRFTDTFISTGDSLSPLLERHGRNIRWADVAARYQGIIIAPYRWDRRLADGCLWYYGWDCASGCIWDASAVASIDVRATAEPSQVAA